MRRQHLVFALCAATSISVAASAQASSGIDSPESGVVQVGRGGAWLARADDPLAAYFNPAGLVRQSSGVHAGLHLMFLDRCFTRLNASGQPVSPGGSVPGPGAEGGPPAEVCAESSPFPNPQLGANFRINDKLAAGFSFFGPHGVGKAEWPESLTYVNKFGIEVTQPAPQRYMLIKSDSTILLPTLSVSYAVNDELAIGAGFIWGMAFIEFLNFTEGLSPMPAAGEEPRDDFFAHLDVQANLKAKDLFIPGIVLGGIWSPSRLLDVAAWLKWQDAINSKADLEATSLYWKQAGPVNDDPCLLNDSDTTNDMGEGCNITNEPGAGDLVFRIPMEAKLGVRFHMPRGPSQKRPEWASKPGVRDFLSEDLFDLEMNFTYARNSVVDNLELRFKPGIPIRGTPGFAPENSDVAHKWKDVFGVRVGGDYVAIPNKLAVRAGAFYESKGQDDRYLNIDFHLGARLGLSAGATFRVWRVDISAAYQHTFFETLDNKGKGELKAISGDKLTGYRSVQAINGGSLRSSLDEVGLAGTLRF